MTLRESDELRLIENAIWIDPVGRKSYFKYPYLKSPEVLQYSREQVLAIEAGVQRSLIKKNQFKAYNEVIQDYLRRGIIRKITQEEMDSWTGPVNYVPHHAVPKPGSLTTALRSVSNSSVKNNGTSLNEILPKGPNSLRPLLHTMTKFRTYKETVVWDYEKA